MNAPLPSHQTPQRKRARNIEGQKAVKARRKRRLLHETPLSTMADPAVTHWLDTFHRYHTDPVRDVIAALKTVEVPASHADEPSTLYVWEVAWCCERDNINWKFIVWDVPGYGVRFLECQGQSEAMALYNLPTEQGIAAVQHAPGVYLRAAARHRKASPEFL